MAEIVYCVGAIKNRCEFVRLSYKNNVWDVLSTDQSRIPCGKNLRSIEGKTFKPKLAKASDLLGQKEESIKSRLWRRTRSNRGVLEII